ncbi:Npun_R2479 family HD domain-containing metalloprotein [Beggiatoa leptomitoformis]|uniref:Metal-dependent phosphohydrolase n=1 Tax=Beggiatoa leptomitoformis TaxID=288004 RepID=A0A2N9YGR7_9GAMM|nr:Npun_R2479 family HD domain-containing metalloprotein [Beggiatoa leptomitoformis]ALG68046.1 metal-dependent phosphohydrolase [Beggiatoa leptomitoformis]AUI69663.1 metal-dependent phosphohydrolase [Beggiatoa leptomitoformis]
MLFNPTELVIDAFVEKLEVAYRRNYGSLESGNGSIIAWAGRMALEHFANSDALYHNMEHTIMVTLVGQEILRGKHIRDGGVSHRDWLNFIISLLCHDIGHVRGICRDDKDGYYTTGIRNEMAQLPAGSTDAAMSPYHVDRGKLFIRERFGGNSVIDAEVIAANIELTRFPVPNDTDHQNTSSYPGLVRAADLIGQLADPNYLRKLPALFYEFQETGINEKLNYTSPNDLRTSYPAFYWDMVSHYIQDGLRYLRVTQEGKQWIANLYSHVFSSEHAEFDVR